MGPGPGAAGGPPLPAEALAREGEGLMASRGFDGVDGVLGRGFSGAPPFTFVV